jgi:hypothetical protein
LASVLLWWGGVMTESRGHDATHADTDAELRRLVLGYLEEHPTAMDTLDGIAGWWILRRQIEIEVRRVSGVLAALVRDGELEEFQQGGVQFFRRLRRARGGPATGMTPRSVS